MILRVAELGVFLLLIFFNEYKIWTFVSADVEAFAKAMETETKSDQEGDSKDKKDDDEDMSLD